MTMPAPASKGTADTQALDTCTGQIAISPSCPATVNANDILIMQIAARAGTSLDSLTIDTSLGTWTKLFENVALPTTRHFSLYYLVAAGTEGGATVPVTYAATGTAANSNALAQIFRFTGSGAGLIDTSSGGTNTGTASSAAVFAAVATSLANQLAVGFVWAITGTTILSSTGETGGDWVEAFAEDTATGHMIDCQTANMASAGTITGGTATLGATTTWRTFSFALKEKDVASSSRPQIINVQQAVHRASRW